MRYLQTVNFAQDQISGPHDPRHAGENENVAPRKNRLSILRIKIEYEVEIKQSGVSPRVGLRVAEQRNRKFVA